MSTSRCCWFNFCLLTAIEFWKPKADSIAADGGIQAFCMRHRIDGSERIRVCEKVGYNVAVHQASIFDHYEIERVGNGVVNPGQVIGVITSCVIIDV